MGGKGNKKKKAESNPQGGANENSTPRNTEQARLNQSTASNQQGPGNRPMVNDPQGSGNRSKANNQQGSDSKPRAENPKGSGDKANSNKQEGSDDKQMSKNPQGSASRPGSGNQQTTDNKPKSNNPQGSASRPGSGNQQRSDIKPKSNNPQGSSSQQTTDNKPKSNNPQGSASRPGSGNQQRSDIKPKSNNPQGSSSQQTTDNKPKSNNPQGSSSQQTTDNKPKSNNPQGSSSQQTTDNKPKSNNPQGSASRPGSGNQQRSDIKPKSNNPQGSSSQQTTDNKPKSNNPQGSAKRPGSSSQQTTDNKPKSNNSGSGNRPKSNNKQQTLNQPITEQFQQLSISSDNQKRQHESKQQTQVAPQAVNAWRQPRQPAPQAQNVWGQSSESAPQDQGAWGQSSKPAPQVQGAWEQPNKSNAPKQKSSQQRDDKVTKQSPPSQPSKELVYTSPTTKMPHLLCPYKGPGTRGTRFRSMLETNYLKLIINNLKKCAYHYDVQIEPDKPKKHMAKIFHQFCVKNFPNIGIAFDGAKNAYAPTVLSLNNVEREVDFKHPDTGNVRKYLVSIKETEDMQIPLDSLTTYQSTRQYDAPKKALQCLEIILKGAYQQQHLEMGVQAARSFYLPPQRREYLGDFFELWYGLFQSTVLGSHIYLNVDVAHKAFPKRYASLVDLLQQIMDEHLCNMNDAIYDMKSHLSGLDVIYQTPGNAGMKRVYKYMALVLTPDRESFKDANGREVTIAAYFKEQKYPIRRPDLPCVKLGNSIKNITVPMEHCSLSDRQAINKKCTENQTRNIIRFAATSTDARKEKIMQLVNQISHNRSPIIRGFGLEVDMNFAKVNARCLNAPKIQYAQNKSVEVRNGVWRGEGMPFLIAESANKWAILNANQRTRSNELQDLAGSLLRVSKPTNLNLAAQYTYIRDVDSRNFANIQKELENAKKEGIRILFCVIPDSGPTYAKIKQLAETRIGVLTQCIKGTTVLKKRADGSTISNILLKVNAKLNGTNHRLNESPILNDKCMLIGADVTHPSPDQKHIPSVVGVAASHDANAFCYNVCWRLQGPRIEIIEDFKEITLEHLKFYRQKNGCLPNKILYYRDGVSEGQFQQVMASEKMAMTQACAEIERGYEKKVKLTIIVVQKRHHTRFFPGQTDIGRNDRRNNNVPAGTIVDTEITHPNENHFYLVSHQSIQGVAKPTKYCLLLDEANHSIDDLQGLSFNLCHLFSRCNRSVSYPAPTYYAHLAAYRGRVYIENEQLNMNRLTDEWRSRAIRDDISKGHPMFFV